MSAVLEQTKQLYRKALYIEILILILVSLSALILGDSRIVLGILFGQIAGFLPHCVFVFWLFFIQRERQAKITAFYRGEGLKWLLTIVLVSIALISDKEMPYGAFFIGYMLALGANSLLPIVLKLTID